MDASLAQLFISKLPLSNTAILVYLIFRADACLSRTSTAEMFKKGKGRYVSGLDIKTIAEQMSEPPLTIQRLIDELLRNRWIKRIPLDYYELGYIENFEGSNLESYKIRWYCDIATKDKLRKKEDRLSDQIRKMVKERKLKADEKVSPKLSDKSKINLAVEKGIVDIIADHKKSVHVGRLFKWFKNYCEETYGMEINVYKEEGMDKKASNKVFPLVYKKLKRLVGWCESEGKAFEYLKYSADNWSKIKESLQLVGDPTISVLCTKSTHYKILGFSVYGFSEKNGKRKDRDGVAKRGSAEEHEDEDDDTGL